MVFFEWNLERCSSFSPFPLYLMNQTCSIQSYPLDGNQTVVEFVVTSSLHLTTQQSSFRSKALLPLYSVEVDLQRKKNKFNDNLLFSCCCARIDWTWTTVCGCYRGGWKCHQNCLEAHYWESVLPNWHCSYSRSLNLVDNNTHWCTDRIYAIIRPTCSKHSSTSWAVIITLISVFLALILISGLLDILYAGHWPANIISRISTAVQIVWRSQLTAFLVHGSLSSVDPLSDADFTLSKGSIPSCVSAQTRESIAYIGRAIAIVKGAKGQKQPSRDLAKEHTIMLEDVMPEDQHAFDLVISQIRTNVGEWLWLNVLTKKESVRCRRCYQRIVR